MAALSGATQRKRRSLHLAERGNMAVGTGAVIYQGSLVSINESTGRAVAATAAAARTFLGVAEETKTGNTGGTVTVNYLFGHQELFASLTALTKSFTGCNVGVSTDNDVGTLTGVATAAARVAVGELMSVPAANQAWVWVRHFSTKTIP